MKTTTPVMFRKWPEKEGGGIIALFPTEPGTSDPYTCDSYESIGRHGSADPVGVIRATKPAKPAEYADLMKELHSIGYRNLVVYHRYQYGWIGVVKAKIAAMDRPRKSGRATYAVSGSKGKSSGSGSGSGDTTLGGIR